MIPTGALSDQAIMSAFVDTIRGPVEFLKDYETAGVALNDGSQGVNLKLWKLQVINEKKEVQVSALGVPWTTLFVRSNPIAEASLAFDNNMNPFVAFVEEGGSAFIYWFDSLDSTQKITSLPAGVINPRCCIDDHRSMMSLTSDIVLAYLRSGSLYVRYQRERYQIEHLMQAGLGADARLVDVGMNRGLRFQWWLRNANPVAGAAVFTSPFLGDIVGSLCRRAGLAPENVNVQELYDTHVIGYKCNTDDGINKRIDALREMFFFDKSETDRKIYFPRRGREITARIPYSDLVADDPSALEQTLVQEIDLPKTVTVTHLDPAGGFANNKQTARRKSNLINATKEQKVSSEVVLTADQGMTAAIVKLKIAWYEQQLYKFTTTLKYANVVETDVVEVEDKKGNWHRIRITEANQNHPTISFEGNADAGQQVYSSLGIGHSLPPPISTTPGLVGQTVLEILNIPALRDQDDELGVYLAVCGQSSAWYGCDILVSTDDGVNFFDAMQIQTPATIGDTLTDLEDEISAEYPADQSFEVLVNFALESLTYDSFLKNGNRCVVGDELMQFQFAVLLGMVGDKYHYRLSGLARGVKATEVEFWPAGTRFVLIDSSVAFLQAQQWMLGKEIQIKPVSLGLTEDETVATAYDYLEGVSQREFPVHEVESSRDGSNNVTVTFIGRGRLGIETAPRNGKYFAGYRIKFSNGHIIDTFNMTGTYNAAPTGITVQVCALNTVTGEGPYSTPIST